MPMKSLLPAAALGLLLGSAQRLPAAVTELRIDPARSHLVAVAHKLDTFSIVRTDHTIAPAEWSVSLCLDLRRPTATGFKGIVDIKTASLRVDAAEDRERAGVASPYDPAASAELQRRLLGPEGLDAARYPGIHWEASSVVQPPVANPIAEGTLTLHGISRPVSAVAEITEIKPAAGSQVNLTGSLTLRQSDFGLPPETADGDDEIRVVFDLWATATGKPCAPSPLSPPRNTASAH
jgi:polyisoprenoid-binding protein YceI